jgi:hypothetical protein
LVNKKPRLKEREKKVLTEQLNSCYVNKLSEWEQARLKKILPALFWAEKQLIEEGKKLSYYIEKFLSFLSLDAYISRTVGPWNFKKVYASRFGYTQKEFVRKLKNLETSTEIVIRYVCEDIGLDKDPTHIFAEYNAGILCTKIAGLQNFLNSFLLQEGKKPLVEDGKWGKETQKAIQTYLPEVFPSFHQKEISLNQLETLFSNELERAGIPIICKIPQLIRKTSWSTVWKPSCSRKTWLQVLLEFFRRDINVPIYVDWGMKAYLAENLLR